MHQFLHALLEWGYIITALFFLLYCSTNKQSKNSVFYTCCIVMGVELLMVILEGPLRSLSSGPLKHFLWFNTFAFCEILALYALYYVHHSNDLTYSKVTRQIQYSYATLCCIQLATYWDKVFYDAVHMASIYQIGVPSIVILAKIVLVVAMCQALIQRKQHLTVWEK